MYLSIAANEEKKKKKHRWQQKQKHDNIMKRCHHEQQLKKLEATILRHLESPGRGRSRLTLVSFAYCNHYVLVVTLTNFCRCRPFDAVN